MHFYYLSTVVEKKKKKSLIIKSSMVDPPKDNVYIFGDSVHLILANLLDLG